MEKYLKIQDTCGVHNLHALPGMLGGFVGAIVAATATVEVYGQYGWVTDNIAHKNAQIHVPMYHALIPNILFVL